MPAVNCTLLCRQETESCRMLLFWALFSAFHQGTQLTDKALQEPSKEDCHRNMPIQHRLLFCTSPYATFITAVFPTVCSALCQSYATCTTGFFSLSPCHAFSSPISRLVLSNCLPLQRNTVCRCLTKLGTFWQVLCF